MKTLLSILFIAILARLSVMVFPFWWGIAPGAALGGLLMARSFSQAMLAGFLGLVLLWGSYATSIDIQNGGRIGAQLAMLTGMPSPLLIFMMTALLGGLVGALSSISGYLLRQLIKP